MRLLRLIFIFLILIVGNSRSQSLTPIPDLTFWNTSYKYHFHYQKENYVPPPSAHTAPTYDGIAYKIASYYLGKSGINKFPFSSIDTNLATLLPKVEEAFSKASIINLDYWDGKDPTFKELLNYLYNATIEKDETRRDAFIKEAKKLLVRIPNSSISKSIAYLQIENADRVIKRKTNNGIFKPNEEVYKEAYRLTNGYSFSFQNLADWNEAMGDFCYQWGDVAKYKDYYSKAIEYEMNYTDSISCMQLQRIREKIFWGLEPEHIFGNIFNTAANEIIFSLKFGVTNRIEEFKNQNKVMAYIYYKDFDDKSAVDLSNDYLESSSAIMPVDFLYFADAIRPIVYSKNDFQLEKELEILVLNNVLKYNLIRFEQYSTMLDNIFFPCLMAKDIKNARIINQYIKRLPMGQGNNHYYQYLLNTAKIYVSENQTDSAKIILNMIVTDSSVINGGVIEKEFAKQSYILLREIAYRKNDMSQYTFYNDWVEKVQTSISNMQNNVTRSIVNEDNNIYTTGLVEEINYAKEWGLQKEILALNNIKLAAQSDSLATDAIVRRRTSDSLRIAQRNIDSLTKRQISDSLIIEKAKTDKLAQDKRDAYLGGGIFILLVMGIGITSVIFVRKNAARVKMLDDAEKKQLELEKKRIEAERRVSESKSEIEKQKIEAEKLKFELESLRTPYLDHAIGDSFKYIIDRIESGIENDDISKLQAAKNITKSTSRIFNDITQHSTETTDLWQELEMNERYVTFVAICAEQSILFENEVVQHIAKQINVPSYFLLDFYRNALQHGRLKTRKGSIIKTQLIKGDTTRQYYLVIEDNGIGFAEAKKEQNQTHISTGLLRVSKQLEIFNREKKGVLILFDSEKGITTMYDNFRNPIGTKITLEIQLYGNN